MSSGPVLVEMFHDPVRLGHMIMYKILEKECQELFVKVMDDYKVKPMVRYELEKVILSPHYIQIKFPKDKDENYDACDEHVRNVRRMVS
jgi:hypothetical protein